MRSRSSLRARRIAAVLAAAALLVVAQPSGAHTPGAQAVAKEATVVLTPAGTPDGEYHAYFSELGFPIGVGDVFNIRWFVNNGSGPDLFFEIHTHGRESTRYFATNASELEINWTVPEFNPDNEFMIYWVNNWPVPVNLTYRIVDNAPPVPFGAGPTPILLAVALMVGAAFGWFLWLKAAPAAERQGPGGRKVDAPPAGQAPSAKDEEDAQAAMGAKATAGQPADADETDQ